MIVALLTLKASINTSDSQTWTVKQSLEGEDLSLNFRVMPPVFQSGTTTYDPSDSPQDGLWDVGGL